ncbi:hypothetical protein DVH24_003736 [Malus domestica]|uniref:Uncharacterized protein n=1 Tax=Malus domestica TaxID=3750 RepID=A0A498II13_MALDO|nr:hypothetical protein DVH24_003736 [Malus domestica]
MRYEIVIRPTINTGRDGTEWDETGRDKMRQNGKGAKMPLDGNKEEKEGDEEVIILCSTDMKRVVPKDEVKRKFNQNSSHGTTRSTGLLHLTSNLQLQQQQQSLFPLSGAGYVNPRMPLRSVLCHVLR